MLTVTRAADSVVGIPLPVFLRGTVEFQARWIPFRIRKPRNSFLCKAPRAF